MKVEENLEEKERKQDGIPQQKAKWGIENGEGERTHHHVHPWKKKNLFPKIPSRTIKVSCLESKLASVMTPTPKQVNFFLTPSPRRSACEQSPGPSSSQSKSSAKTLSQKIELQTKKSGVGFGQSHRTIIINVVLGQNFLFKVSFANIDIDSPCKARIFIANDPMRDNELRFDPP